MRYLSLILAVLWCSAIALIAWLRRSRAIASTYAFLCALLLAWAAYARIAHIPSGWNPAPTWWPAWLPELSAAVLAMSFAISLVAPVQTVAPAVLVLVSASAMFVSNIHTDFVTVRRLPAALVILSIPLILSLRTASLRRPSVLLEWGASTFLLLATVHLFSLPYGLTLQDWAYYSFEIAIPALIGLLLASGAKRLWHRSAAA